MRQHFFTRTVGVRLFLGLLFLLFGSAFLGAQTFTINGETNHQATVGDSLELLYTFTGSDTAFTVEVFLDADDDGAATAADILIFHSEGEEDFFVDGGFNDDDGARDGQLTILIDEFFEVAPAQFIFVCTQESGASASAILAQEHKPSNTVVAGFVSVPDSVKNIFVFAQPQYWDDNGDSSNVPPNSAIGNLSLGKVANSATPKELKTLLQSKAEKIFGAQQDDDPNDGPWCGYDPGNDDDGDKDYMFFATRTDENGEFSIPLPNDATIEQRWMLGTFDEFGVLTGFFPPPPIEFSLQSPPLDADFQYIPTNSQIVGTVTDKFGNPLLDFFGNPLEVEVFAWNDDGPGPGPELHTNTVGGTFVLDVLPGKYGIGVGHLRDRFLHPEPQFVEIFENATITVDFMLLELDSFIAGQVWIRDEGPVECVRIEAKSHQGGWSEAWTDGGGNFWLRVSSQADPWDVWLDEWSMPHDLMVEGDPHRVVSAGNDSVNFILIRREAPPEDPEIVSIHDIRGDQGKQVRVTFRGSAGDFVDEFGNSWGEEIGNYHLWRRGPQVPYDGGDGNYIEYDGQEILKVANLQAAMAKGSENGDRIFDENGDWLWDFIVTIPAVRQPHYSYVAPTLRDSTAFGPGWTHFRVSAQSAWSQNNWFSFPDSGYSVDNLFPKFAGLSAYLEDSGVLVAWLLDNTPDLAAVRVYRGTTANFSPDASNLIATVKDNSFFDTAGDANSYYIAVLLDDAGNATRSVAVKASLTNVDELFAAEIPQSFELKQNYPNPFNPSTRIMFAVPQKAFVNLAIYDVLGRKIRTLAAKNYAVGYHSITWDGMDQNGLRVPSGLYIYKLVTGNTVLQQKMTLTK